MRRPELSGLKKAEKPGRLERPGFLLITLNLNYGFLTFALFAIGAAFVAGFIVLAAVLIVFAAVFAALATVLAAVVPDLQRLPLHWQLCS